jgi:uncharacterized protein YbjT (DUF2867 family)
MEIAVVGGTGTVGRRLVERLRALRHEVRALGRATGFDLDAPSTWGGAFEGARRAFYLTRHGEPSPDALGATVFEAMRKAGVERVVNLTGFGVERNATSPMRRLERTLEESGLGFTHLRPNYFLQNFCVGPAHLDLLERDEIAMAAGDARFSYIDARDIAAVAAEALTRDEFEGTALDLTGPAGVTHHEIAEALSRATGRPIRYRALSDAEERARLSAAGMAPQRIEARLGFLALARTGAFSAVSPDVERVLGRPALTIDAFARDHAERWRADRR